MTLALVQHTGINQEWADEFADYRKEDLKKPFTPRGLKMFTKKLSQWDERTQERLISHAMECGWKTVYYVEPPKRQSSRDSDIMTDLTDTSWAK